MPRLFPKAIRQSLYDAVSDDDIILLASITSADFDETVHLSSDPTTKIGIDQPVYATVSNGQNYYWAMLQMALPDDEEDKPPSVSLAFENITSALVEAVQSTLAPASVDLKIIERQDLDVILAEITNMKVVGASYNDDRVTLEITREPFTSEPWPAGRMTKPEFPGLHR